MVSDIDASSQIIALVLNALVLGVLAFIGWVVRKAYYVIRDSLSKLEDVQERIGTLEQNDQRRAQEYQGIRDELFYLKGVTGVPMDKPASAAAKL